MCICRTLFQSDTPVVLGFFKALFKVEKCKLFFKGYLNVSVIYGSTLTVEEIASHPHEKKKNNLVEGVRLDINL